MKNDFLIRLRSSLIIIVMTGLLLYIGGIPLFAMIAVISLAGLFELYQALGIKKTSLAAAGMVGSCLFLEAVYLGWNAWLLLVLFLAFVLVAGVFVFTFPRYNFTQTAYAFFGIFYIPVMLSFIYRIRAMEDGFVLVWLVFIASWGSDTLAYCAGLLFGKHKMTPLLSPKKTWEGAAGGVLGSAMIGLIYVLILRSHFSFINNPLLVLPLLCALGSVISQIGDLTASAIKRSMDVKDYGNLIPGHGGILDRFDSVIATAPIVYYLLLMAH